MKKYLLCLMMMVLAVSSKAAPVQIIEQAGWFESGYVTWQKTTGLEYNVYVSPAATESWTKLDDELVREYPTYGRADALGLAAGSYKFKVVPVSNDVEVAADATVSEAITVKAHDRSGFAHFRAGSDGIGAYNNDGTLKDNARVLYVWAGNAKTVTLDVATNSAGKTASYTGLQQIIYGYQKGDANGSFDKRPLCVRIIGTLKDSDMDAFGSSSEGLQIKGAKTYQAMNITIEGVGNDAAVWGFGFLIRNAAKVELRNFGIYLCMDDCVSIDTKNEMIWVHNIDFFYGNTGGDADQAKGDGALDFKGDTKYCTFSYNHFFDTGKSNLGGLSESGDNFITLHHNWYDHSDSRHPRIRRMSMHIYNNYFDGNAKYGVGMTTGGSAFVENNYFRNCKNPMLISLQGTDAEGSGTFSGENGGVIKSFGNIIIGARKCVSYQENPDAWDRWEATSRNDQVPASVTAKVGGTAYNNFDTNSSLMYSYTPDAAADVPTIVKGQYGAGRMQHGDFKWTFNNSLQDENYGVITELKSALQSYKSTLIGFFDGVTIANGGATTTVDAGDGKGLTDEQNDSYVPSWAGGDGSSVVAGLPDPRFCGPETETGSKKYDFLWFNSDNATAINGYISDSKLVISDGSFKPDTKPAASDNSVTCDQTGVLEIKQNASVTFYCENGFSSLTAKYFRTGSASGEIQLSKDGTTFTKIGDFTQKKKGNYTMSASGNEASGPIYIRIVNKASGTLYITGVKIMYPDPSNPDVDPDPAEDPTPTTSKDATAEFTLNGDEIAFINDMMTETIEFNDATTSYTMTITPNAEGATVKSVTGATKSGDAYVFDAPEAGNSVTVTIVIQAEDGTTTKTYTIKVNREIDPSTIPVETGSITLQSDNVPDGYKVDGSASVTAYTYSSDLCRDAKLFKATAAQHTVTLPANAKVTKIVMYAVGDNNTANKGKITELAGQTFAVDLPSRKSGTAFATATVENVEITGSFTYTVSYAAGVKFALTVENASGSDDPGDDPGEDPVTPPTPTTETIFSTDVIATAAVSIPALTTQEITATQATTTGGTISAVNNFTSTEKPDGDAKEMIKKNTNAFAYQFTNHTTFFKIVLNKALAVGDVITARGICGTTASSDGLERGIWISTEDARPSECSAKLTIAAATSAAWGDLSSYTVQEGDGLAGATTIYLYRATAKSTYFDEFKITRTTTTAINGIETVRPADRGAMYDLSGRRITEPRRGQLYIQNGKKYIYR